MNKLAKIGVGIVTYNRPDYFERAVESVRKHLNFVDEIVMYHDGPISYADVPYVMEFTRKKLMIASENKGVAHAKNVLFQCLLDKGCDYIFIMEDDIEILDKRAITHYLAAVKMTGLGHLMFAHHGPGNIGNLIETQPPLSFYKSCVGAWCLYMRKDLEEVGLMDENFNNAWEHVEHTRRIMKLYNVPYGCYPDIIGSQSFIREQPDSIKNSAIGPQENPERLKAIIDGLLYWQKKEPDFPAAHTLQFYLEERERLERERG